MRVQFVIKIDLLAIRRTSGGAMVITDNAGPVELLACNLFWLSMYANYL